MDKVLNVYYAPDNSYSYTIYFNEDADESKNYQHSDPLVEVSKEEFDEFIKQYPNELEQDYYMDWFTWNDFSKNGGCVWPESVIAMMSDGSYDQPIVYKITNKTRF